MDLANEARALRDDGDVNDATALLESERDQYPRHLALTLLTQAELLAQSGRTDLALETLDSALAKGCRYRKEWIVSNARLAPLQADGQLAAFAERAQRAYDEASAAAKPQLMFAMPDTLPDAFGYPLLMVMHGNNSNAKETAPRWTPVADKGWVVAVPQSSEVGASPGAYTWNDRERAASEIELHLDRVKLATEIDTAHIQTAT